MKLEFVGMTMPVHLTIGVRAAALVRRLEKIGVTPTLMAGPKLNCLLSVELNPGRGPFSVLLIDIEDDTISLLAADGKSDRFHASLGEALRAVEAQGQKPGREALP